MGDLAFLITVILPLEVCDSSLAPSLCIIVVLRTEAKALCRLDNPGCEPHPRLCGSRLSWQDWEDLMQILKRFLCLLLQSLTHSKDMKGEASRLLRTVSRARDKGVNKKHRCPLAHTLVEEWMVNKKRPE